VGNLQTKVLFINLFFNFLKKIQTQNNSVLLDLQTNSLSDQFSSYSNMIGENDNYLTQQLNNIQSTQQSKIVFILKFFITFD